MSTEYRVEVNDGPGTLRHALKRDPAELELQGQSLRNAAQIDAQTRENLTPDDDPPTYADHWFDRINEAYTDDAYEAVVTDCAHDDESYDDVARRVLTKAADCLRGGETQSFNGEELDLIRHLMPAHEVHQSMARHFVNNVYGGQKK